MKNTPKMSKGQFDALAFALKQERPERNWLNKRVQWEKDVKAIAEVCHDASNFTPNGNRAFDMDRFLKAAGLVSEEEEEEERGAKLRQLAKEQAEVKGIGGGY